MLPCWEMPFSQEIETARRAADLSAEQGQPGAEFNLGLMYATGQGVPQDYVRAHMWFSLSAAQGEQRAVKTLEMAERRMPPAQINEAQKLARDWKPATKPTPH